MNGISTGAHGYPAPVWQLFNQTPCAGTFESGTLGLIQAKVGTPANEAVLELSVIWKEHHVAAARFRAYGCPATIAVGAWLALWCRGRGVAELSQLCATDISCALEMTEDRTHCALMGEDVVRAILASIGSEVKA